MLGRFFPRALGTRRRIHPMADESRTIDDAHIHDESALHENTRLRRAAQLRLLCKLNAAGVTLNDVRTMIGRSTAPEAVGRSINRTPAESDDGEMNSARTRRNLIFKLLRPKEYAKSSAACTESCCICQGDYEGGEEVAVLRCRHKFHAGCVARWLTQRNVCPVCKKRAISLV